MATRPPEMNTNSSRSPRYSTRRAIGFRSGIESFSAPPTSFGAAVSAPAPAAPGGAPIDDSAGGGGPDGSGSSAGFGSPSAASPGMSGAVGGALGGGVGAALGGLAGSAIAGPVGAAFGSAFGGRAGTALGTSLGMEGSLGQDSDPGESEGLAAAMGDFATGGDQSMGVSGDLGMGEGQGMGGYGDGFGAAGDASAGDAGNSGDAAGGAFGGGESGGGFGGDAGAGGDGGGGDGGGGGCFITEAVMAAGGQGEGAPELQAMRHWRDNILMRSPAGQAIVQHYYQIAPLVVEAVGQRPDAMAIFQTIKANFIDPTVQCIMAGDYTKAAQTYTEMIAYVTPFAMETVAGAEGPDRPAPGQEGMDQLASEAAMISYSPEHAAAINQPAQPGAGLYSGPMANPPARVAPPPPVAAGGPPAIASFSRQGPPMQPPAQAPQQPRRY